MDRLIYFLGIVLTGNVLMAEPLPVSTFFQDYDYSEARLSPDGSCIAVLAPCGFHNGLAVVDLENNAAHWAYTNDYVSSFQWVNTNRILFSEPALFGSKLSAVNKDGTGLAVLVSPNHRDHAIRQVRLLSLLRNSPDFVLVNSTIHSEHTYDTLLLFPNVEKMNIFTGETTMVLKNPGKVFGWVADHNGVIRAGIAKEEKVLKILYRADAKSPWTEIGQFNVDRTGFVPETFAPDNRTLYVSSEGDGDTMALYSFDCENKRIKDLAFRHEEVDIDHLIYSGMDRKLVGVAYETDRPERTWFDSKAGAIQASLDKALTNRINRIVNTSWDGNKALVLSYSDRTPGIYYLYDRSTMKLRKLFDVAEWIHPEEMAEMKPIEYKARDGVTIHGYLTLPASGNRTNVPLVVNPHGGPLMRDTWDFDPAVQFLANRGYAVLQMNFRGSTGYGKKFREAGYHEWGLKQQDDITDGVRWAIERGTADPKRIAVCGGSYGGFAALTGLEKTPELYRCGIVIAPVTDILQTMDPSGPTLTMFKMFVTHTVGDLKKDKKRLKENSPIENVDKIQVPVFVAGGELDPKVPANTIRDFAKALKKRGKLYELMMQSLEGHGYVLPGDRIEFWTKAEECLKANMN